MARGNLVFSSGNEASPAGCPIGQSIMVIVETCLVETCQCLTAVKSVCCSRGCPPRMQKERLSSQDAEGEAVLPGCSRASQQRCSAGEAVLPGCRRRGCPPRMQKERLSSQDAGGRQSRDCCSTTDLVQIPLYSCCVCVVVYISTECLLTEIKNHYSHLSVSVLVSMYYNQEFK
ncbi:hypothetical protein NQZ68_040911 [Dissostichus eleginoides]|nr:hypothetical protein NQZ68_040911 [Dissostichus eleginoides]